MTVAIVTGAGRGIGAAVARRLHGDGWTVVLADLDGDAVGALARDLGSTAVPLAMDVRDPESWAAAVAAAHEAGDLGALVNGAARTVVRDLFAIEPEEWDDVLATNLRARFSGSAPSARISTIAAPGGSSTSHPTPHFAVVASPERTTRRRRPASLRSRAAPPRPSPQPV